MDPLVTVNILAFNRREELRETLQHIQGDLDYPQDRLEVIVVDNGSTDGTEEMVAAEFPSVQVIRRPDNIGIAAWNEGFTAGTGDWFLVLDDDCYVTGDALRRALDGAREHAADLVSFRVASPYIEDYYFNDAYNAGLLSFWGCAALVSREAIRRTGGFDPGIFIWAHELEFTTRVLDAGLAHLFLPEVVAVHMTKPPFRGDSGFAPSMHNLAYIAVRSLRAPDAVRAIANLLVRIAWFQAEGRTSWDAYKALYDGCKAGRRRRRPLRRDVSKAYRRNLMEFGNPLALLRGPRARIEAKRHPERVANQRQSILARTYARKSRFYPTSSAASLRI